MRTPRQSSTVSLYRTKEIPRARPFSNEWLIKLCSATQTRDLAISWAHRFFFSFSDLANLYLANYRGWQLDLFTLYLPLNLARTTIKKKKSAICLCVCVCVWLWADGVEHFSARRETTPIFCLWSHRSTSSCWFVGIVKWTLLLLTSLPPYVGTKNMIITHDDHHFNESVPPSLSGLYTAEQHHIITPPPTGYWCCLVDQQRSLFPFARSG